MKGIIFIGLQASGKSSFFLQNFYEQYLRLNLDMLKTRNRERILFQACLESKQPCVIDNTNPTKASRANYIDLFKRHRFEVSGYYFESKIAECLQRNAQRTGKSFVPELAVKGTYNKLELPSYAEGFDKLFYVQLVESGFNIQEWET